MKTRSLSHKLLIVFSAILITVLLLNMFFNALLLSRVYKNRKIDAMEHLYSVLYNQYKQNEDISSIKETIKNTLSKDNLRVFIWSGDNRLVIDSFPFLNENYEDIFERQENNSDGKSEFHPPSKKDDGKWKNAGRMEQFLLYCDIENDNLIKKNSNYEVFYTENFFSSTDEEYFYLRGNLPDNGKLLIQMPVASVDEAAGVSNSLLLVVGSIMLIVGIIVVYITSRNIAKPVKELSEIALSMTNLDFSMKYNGERNDEIGSLGKSINTLSDRLKETIDELCEKNEKLVHDNELKSRIDTMRKEFIANASHELKTPVALISGYAEGLKDNIASDEAMRNMYTDVIIEETEKMNHIIKQMLDLMELDSAPEVFEQELISVKTLVEDVLNSFDVILKAKSINVELNLEESLVTGDYWRLYQALVNYVSNAINHVNDEKIIRITSESSETTVKISVFNSGASIPEGDVERIWERFYKVDKSHSRQYGGTGIGLSIVKSIVELHKGKCGVINHADGVEFYMVLKKENTNEF